MEAFEAPSFGVDFGVDDSEEDISANAGDGNEELPDASKQQRPSGGESNMSESSGEDAPRDGGEPRHGESAQAGSTRASLFEQPLPQGLVDGPIKRVACGFAWVVHGFCVEFESRRRHGVFLRDNKSPIEDLNDDRALKTRMARWEMLEADEYIIEVSGKHSNFGYLVGSIILQTSTGRRIPFEGTRKYKFAKGPEGNYCFKAREGHEICGIEFDNNGRCLGISERDLKDLTTSAIVKNVPEQPRKQTEGETISAISNVNYEALLVECAPAGTAQEAVEAVNNNKNTWMEFILQPAKQLDLRFNAEWKKNKKWHHPCLVCGACMARGAEAHLRGKLHYEKLRGRVKQKDSDDAKKWDQQFLLFGEKFLFHHLTGHLRLGDDGIVVDRKPRDKDKSASSKRIREDTEGVEEPPRKKPISEQRPQRYADALKDAKQWRAWMEDHARELQEALQDELDRERDRKSRRGQKRRQDDRHLSASYQRVRFVCAICPEKEDQDASVHLVSDAHRSRLKKQWKEAGWPLGSIARGCLSQWTQQFSWPSGSFFFNHLTGEQCRNTSSTNKRLPWPSLRVCFLDKRELPDAKLYGYELASDVSWEDAKKEYRCGMLHGWTHEHMNCLLKPRQRETGHRRWCNNLAWKIRLPPGAYTVRLGMLLERQRSDSQKLQRIRGQVNGEDYDFYVSRRDPEHYEHIIETSVIDGRLIICGTWPIYYVHIKVAEENSRSVRRRNFDRDTVPSFRADLACGKPKDWNRPDNVPIESDESALFWGRRAKEFFCNALDNMKREPILVDLQLVSEVMREFLRSRPSIAGESNLFDKLGPPLLQDDGWFCFAWRPYLDNPCVSDNASEYRWHRAWHGCKFEALYSIMYHGQLLPSSDKSLGDRLLGGIAGVYVHQDKTSHKANNYVRFVPLCNDGVFWAAKWEVRVNRKKGVPLDEERRTDQWIQPPDSVRLAALWLCGRTAAEMQENDPVAREWKPELEAHPKKIHDMRSRLPEPLD